MELVVQTSSSMSDCQQPSTKHTINDGCHMLLVMLDMQDLCWKCIKHNASCGKAWERLGSILEREQAYKVSFLPTLLCQVQLVHSQVLIGT